MVEGGMKAVKYLVFFFNFIFWLCGGLLIIIGGLAQSKYSEYTDIAGGIFTGLPIYIIIVGCVIFVVAFLGCCGAAKENYCMITTFAVLLILILLLEIAAVIAGYVLKDEIEDAVNESLLDAQKEYIDGNEVVQETYDALQQEFKCCGANSSKDWIDQNATIPDSCCKNMTEGCATAPGVTLDDIYTEGCTQKLEATLINNFEIISGVAIGIAVIELLGIICACCLMRAIKSEYEVV